MAKDAAVIRQRLKDDFEFYARNCLKMRQKSGAIQPFQLNKAQQYVHSCLEQQRKETGKVRAIILKGRQMGASTLIGGRFYWRVTHRAGVRVFILTHEAEATSNLFDMVARYHQLCPEALRPKVGTDSAKELTFTELDSGYKVGTAGNKSVGRSSTIQYFHGSEAGFWPNAAEHAKGVLQAVPDAPDTEVILESTANGLGNYFHQQWLKAEAQESEFQAIFVPWYWQPEYRKSVPKDFHVTDYEDELKRVYGLDDEQLMFRRSKMAELADRGDDGTAAFKQEYPMTAQEAFISSGKNSLIPGEVVSEARKVKCLGRGPLKIGVDPARFGDDRTAIIRRRGRAAYDLEVFEKIDTMEIAGIVNAIIKAEKPSQVAIDVGGLGAGVVDRLLELGRGDVVVPINFGSTALDPTRYVNRRAEMWHEMRDWLKGDMPVMIPDRDDLHTDLIGPTYRFDSNSRRKLESKDEMKKRGLRSSDCGDALALTFAEPVKTKKKTSDYEVQIADAAAGY